VRYERGREGMGSDGRREERDEKGLEK